MRPRELDHRLGFETEEMTLDTQQAVHDIHDMTHSMTCHVPPRQPASSTQLIDL